MGKEIVFEIEIDGDGITAYPKSHTLRTRKGIEPEHFMSELVRHEEDRDKSSSLLWIQVFQANKLLQTLEINISKAVVLKRDRKRS